MRMSASGLLSTIAVAIDQILRLAPSIRPPIDPVVSRTNATSTDGLALAAENAPDRPMAVNASAKILADVTGFIFFSSWFRPSELRFPPLHGPARSKTRRGGY